MSMNLSDLSDHFLRKTSKQVAFQLTMLSSYDAPFRSGDACSKREDVRETLRVFPDEDRC